MALLRDLRVAFRSLRRAPALWIMVALTLALGIGANAAIFSVLRGVLLRPLANRDEDRLIYIRQSAPGLGIENATFSIPEISDLGARLKTITKLGTFSTIDFTVVGLGEPREIRAGVVDGAYFEVMGLRPVIGRLLKASDDGPKAAGAVVLTFRFWANTLHSDRSVIGKSIRLGSGYDTRAAVVVGVLEPSVPYPVETELIANVVTSPHHLSATMVTGREHRMTEVFGRLAPGADLESARAELRTVYSAMLAAHPEVYKPAAHSRIDATRMHDQINSRARTVLWVLLAASGLLFVIACANVANLILARTVRRESEFALRAALGATGGVIRRCLLAEGLILCGSGGLAGIVLAVPMFAVLGRYASRFSIRALDLTLDSTLLWIGVPLALASAVFLAYVPRLGASHGLGRSGSGARVAGGGSRRLRAFAVTQIAASFLLLAGAGVLLRTLVALENTQPAFDTARVLVVNLPVMAEGRTPEQIYQFYREAQRRVSGLPGVERVATGLSAPWRDSRWLGVRFAFSVEGLRREDNRDDLRARFRTVSPGYFATLGIPMVAGRDFNEGDRRGAEPVVIISSSVAQRLFHGQEALNQHLMWTDPVMKFINISTEPRRIVGIVADLDDESIIPATNLTVYHPFEQEAAWTSRLFVRAENDPYALVPSITRTIRALAADQPVERPNTLEDVRAEVLAPNRLNAIVFGGFGALALTISVVGVAGVLAFSVSWRTREFGIRLALGALPQKILTSVLAEGIVMAVIGVVVGFLAGFGFSRLLGSYIQELQAPGPLPLILSAVVILGAAITASTLPAARAARVDPVRALRAE